MARPPKPWFWASRNGWYVTIRGERHFLGEEKDASHTAFHLLMAKPAERVVIRSDSVVALIDQFLEWVELHRAADTYIWYQSRLELFARKYPDLLVGQLKAYHVQQWIDSFKVSNGTKRNYARSIQRCMRWCEEQGIIDRSPIAHFKKPRGGIREVVISEKEYKAILGAIKRQPFKDLVTFAWETGARAAECLAIESRHVDLRNHRVVFPRSEEKMERQPRVIYLTDASERILKRLSRRTGFLFRNTDGVPWTTEAVNCAFIRIQGKLKKKYCLTAFRHSFAHRKLREGVDALTVSVLMGHKDTSTLARVYSHLTQAPDYLLKALRA